MLRSSSEFSLFSIQIYSFKEILNYYNEIYTDIFYIFCLYLSFLLYMAVTSGGTIFQSLRKNK